MRLLELLSEKRTKSSTKRKDKDARDGSAAQNLVAKNAREFNKAATHRDRKNDYKRKPKHSARDQ